MRNLDLVIQTAATALNVPEASVRSRWTLLRKAGLWSKVGPGRGMPDPTPTDITNLLLSFLGGGLVTETADTVNIVRDSGGTRPPIVGLEELADDTLGTTLDALFARLAREGELAIDRGAWATGWKDGKKGQAPKANRRITYCELSVRRTWLGWQAEILVGANPNGHLFSGNYQSADPQQADLVIETDPRRMLDKLCSRNLGHPDRISKETVGYATIAALAACLRGDAVAAGELLSWRAHVQKRTEGWFSHPGVDVNLRSGMITVIEPHPGGREEALEEAPSQAKVDPLASGTKGKWQNRRRRRRG